MEGEIRRVVVRRAHRLPARLHELGRPGVRAVDVVHQLVGHQGLVVDVHAQVAPDVLAARVVQGLAGGPAALRRAIGHQVPIAAGPDVRAAHHELPDALRVGDGRHHRRLAALRAAHPVRPLDAEGVQQRDRGPRLHRVHSLPVDDGTGLAEVRQVHEDAAEVGRERADRLVEGDPRGGAGAVGVQEQHRIARAHVVIVDGHLPGLAGGLALDLNGPAGALLGEPIRRDERHGFLLRIRPARPGPGKRRGCAGRRPAREPARRPPRARSRARRRARPGPARVARSARPARWSCPRR